MGAAGWASAVPHSLTWGTCTKHGALEGLQAHRWLCTGREHYFAPLSAGQKMTGVECVEGMASGLYEELFAALVSMINRYMGSTASCRAQ